jgi:hypothetical protein
MTLHEHPLRPGTDSPEATGAAGLGIEPRQRDIRVRLAQAAVLALAVLLALAAVALVTASFASYAWVKARLDSFASDGDADVTRSDFDGIVLRLRAVAALVLAAGVAIGVARRPLTRQLDGLLESIGVAFGVLSRGFTAAVARTSSLHLATLAALTAGAIALRLDFLFQPMRYDESVTYIHYASRPWYIALTAYTGPNNHVFHSLLVHVSTALFGGEPWAIRLPAFIAGVLLVPATYVAGRAIYDASTALLAAALVASSSWLVGYSTNARGYTLVALVFVLLLALAARLRSSASAAEWLAFAVLGAIGFATVPVMLYAFGAVVVWLALSMFSTREQELLVRRLLPALVTTAVLVGVVYAPIVAASGVHALVANEFVESHSWSTFTSELPDSVQSVVEGWHRDVWLPLAVVLGASFAVGLALRWRPRGFRLPPAAAALIWIAPVLVVQRVVPFDRVWLFLLPLYLLTASAGIVALLRRLPARTLRGRERAVVAALALALGGSLAGNVAATRAVYHSEETSTLRDGRSIAALLDERLRPGDKVIVAPPADAILEYWLGRRGLNAASLLYWGEAGSTRRFLVVVKLGPDQYTLSEVLSDPRLRGVHLGAPEVVRRYPSSIVYEVERTGA